MSTKEYPRPVSAARPMYAWIIWLLGSAFMFYKYAIEVSPSVMTSDLMRAFGINGTELGNLAACYFYAYLLMQIPAGILVDRFGPRRVTSVAIILCAAGTLLFAHAPHPFIAGVGRFLTGAGAAFAAITCMKLISNWFPANRFALMAGLMMTMGMLGAVGGQAPLSAFIDHLGWRSALEVIALIGLGFGVLFWLIVRDRAVEDEIEIGMAPKSESLWTSCMEIFKNRQAWALSLYSGLAFAPVSVFGGLWGVPFLMQSFNLTQTMAAHQVSLIFIGFAVGAPMAGWFSDWLGQRKVVMFWGTVIALAAITAVILAPAALPSAVLSGLLFTFGFTISGFLLCFTMIREISRPLVAATAIGFMNAFDALFGALSDPLTGKFLDMGWTGEMLEGARVFPTEIYKLSLLTLPLFLVISLITMAFIKETNCKETVR